MTKYILNSGGLKSNPQKAEKFLNEIVDGLGERPKILLCFFAEKREDWEMKFKKYIKGFLKLINKDIAPKFELALPDQFKKQVQNNDVVYLYGGDDFLLQSWLKQFDLPSLWKGKTVASSSAGSNVLVEYFWTCDWRACRKGFGLLPIKFISHYKSDFGRDDPRGPIDWRKAHQELEKYGDSDLPIHALKEGEYVIIER